MDDFKMNLDEMVSNLDTACGMLLVGSMRNPEVRTAMEMVTKVSLALGEVEELKFYDYESEDEE